MKLVKKLTLGLGLLLSACHPVYASEIVQECPYFTPEQLLTMQRAYEAGDKIDMNYTMAAIALQESNAGEQLVNHRTRDYGVFQNHLKTVASREGVKPSKHLANKLVKNFDYSADHAVKELEYWKQVRKDRLQDVLASYNAGFNMKAGRKYANEVMDKIAMLQNCVDFS